MQRYHRIQLSLLLALLRSIVGVEASSWNLPSSRVVSAIPGKPALLRHDFGISGSRRPMLLGLKGGEQQQPTSPTTTATTITAADEIARGGGATTTLQITQRAKEEEEATEHFVAQHEISIGNSTVTSISNAATTATTTTPSTSLVKTTLPKKKKDKFHKRIAKKLKNRNATNLRRKVMHASFGMFFAALNHLIPKEIFVPGMAVLSSATLVMELLRYRKGFAWMNKALHFVVGQALRKHEMDGKFTGSFYFFTGVTLTAALFPTTSATLGIIQLAIADPTASYFGRATRHVYWSRIENGLGGIGRNKGFLGFLGGALCCVPFNYRILSIAKFGAEGVPGGKASLALASLAIGMAGAFADLAVPTPALTMPKRIWGVRVPPFHLDDNFVVPLVSGYACTQVFRALGWQQNVELARFLFV